MTKVSGQVSAFPCCCLGRFLAHGQLSQAILSMSCAVTVSSAEPLQCCLQRLHGALLLPAFKGPLLLFLCHLREWQDPAPEVLSHFAELSFPAQIHRCIITTDPSIPGPGKRDRTPGHSLHKWGRGDLSIAHGVLYYGAECPAERGQHCSAMPQDAGDRIQVTAPNTHHGRAHSFANTQMLHFSGIAIQRQGTALHITSKSFQRAKEERKD